MGEREEKYVPDMLTMSMDEQAGGADANKKQSEKRLEKFKKGIEEMKDGRFYDETGLRRSSHSLRVLTQEKERRRKRSSRKYINALWYSHKEEIL